MVTRTSKGKEEDHYDGEGCCGEERGEDHFLRDEHRFDRLMGKEGPVKNDLKKGTSEY